MKYRKKPVDIEARRLQDPETPERIAKWCGGRVEYKPHTGGGPSCHIIIPTLEGDMKAERGDYIIKVWPESSTPVSRTSSSRLTKR